MLLEMMQRHYYICHLLIFLVSIAWICICGDTVRNIMVDGWTGPVQNTLSIRHHRHRPNPSNGIIRQHMHDRTRITATDFIHLSLSSSINENDDNNNLRSALVEVSSSSSTTTSPSLQNILDSAGQSLLRIIQTMSMTVTSQKQQSSNTSNEKYVQEIVHDILQICDEYDQITNLERNIDVAKRNTEHDWIEQLRTIDGAKLQQQFWQSLHQSTLQLQKASLQYQRYELLVQLMQMNYTTYITTATFLCSDSRQTNSNNKIQRYDLPNVQDVPYISAVTTATTIMNTNDDSLVPDCTLNDMEYQDSILDQALLYIFRSLVTKHTNGVTSSIPGIRGLLEQGRTFMVQQKDNPPEVQHIMVQNTLRDLMTPILPPFYRIFMSGIIPKVQLPYNNITLHAEEKQYGPWFYAPFLTAYITPIFFKFLVGPSYPNRHRHTGSYGGLLVTKCKFLQESNCKGLCLHQCKLPAQNFFQTALGLSLNVVPNFVTQECQWSFNEVPITPVSDDPSFPSGCIRGCTSRMIMKEDTGSSAPICN